MNKPQLLGVPSLAGEVDVVAFRPGSPVIWLIEVKDPTDDFVAPEIRRGLDKFYVTHGKKKAYADQLAAKHDDLQMHVAAVAAALKLPPAVEAPYEVRPIFVTRRPVQAAFVSASIPFATLQNLMETLAEIESEQ